MEVKRFEAFNQPEHVSRTGVYGSDCNSIAFKNIGNVNAKVNGIPLAVGDPMLSFPNFHPLVVDVTRYNIEFERRPDNANFVGQVDPNAVNTNVTASLSLAASASGGKKAVITLSSALANACTVTVNVSYNINGVAYGGQWNINIPASDLTGFVDILTAAELTASDSLYVDIINVFPNPNGTHTVVYGNSTDPVTPTPATPTNAPNPLVLIIRTVIKGV